MITTVHVILMGLSLLNCERRVASVGSSTNQVPSAVDSIDPRKFFTLSNAEKILGQEAHRSDSAIITEPTLVRYNFTYTANSEEPGTGRTGNIYFMFEEYAQVATAGKVYSDIRNSNSIHDGFKELHGMGDEAYFHSDGENFLFVMVRHEGRILRMKVNKITNHTSLDEFNLLAKSIGDLLSGK